MITHRRIGDCFLQIRSLDDALTHYQRYLKLAVSLNNRVEEQRAYHTIGESYFEKYEDEDILTKKKKLLKLSDLSYIKSYRIWESLTDTISEKERKEMLCSNLLNRGKIIIFGQTWMWLREGLGKSGNFNVKVFERLSASHDHSTGILPRI